MLAVTHTVTSAAIGAQVESVPFAFGLAFLFHHFADTLLHWNIYTERHRWAYEWIVVDVLGGLLVAYWLLSDRFFSAPVLAALLGGNLSDIWASGVDVLRRLLPRYAQFLDRLYDHFHERLQNETLNPAKGLVWQAVLMAIAVLLTQRPS